MLELSPRTPTPFKHAMAEVERRARAKEWVSSLATLLVSRFRGGHNGHASKVLTRTRMPQKEHKNTFYPEFYLIIKTFYGICLP